MPDWMTVARWEAMRILARKDFVISTLLIPVMVAGGIGVGRLVKQRADAKVARIAVLHVDGTTATLPELKGFRWMTPEPQDRDRAALARLVTTKAVDGALLLPMDLASADTVEALVRWPRQGWVPALEQLLLEQGRVIRARGLGLDAAALARLDRPIRLEERVTLSASTVGRVDRMVAVGTILLFITVLFTTISYMGVGISGEKQARVTEVIISAVSPQAWIDGKIAAYAIVGVLQVLIWVLTALGALAFVLATLPSSLNPVAVGVSLAFAAAGFAFYVAMFAMIMATIKDLQSTSKFQAYLLLIPFMPFFFMVPVLRAPDALWVVLLSQLPVFSPMLVPARFAIGGIAAWEVALSFLLLVLGFHFMRLAAGAAFRIGMLLYGKEISLPELWRWSKTG